MTMERAKVGSTALRGAPLEGWLVGGGEMGAIMRATDWPKTGFGPVEGWPSSLKTMVGVVLGSRSPMLLWWGPDLLQVYNDAFRPILRDKHPGSVAAPAAEVWAEVWDVGGPMATSILEGGPATWREDLQLFIHNGGRSEETYFTFSYSPVPGDDGGVGGVLVTVQETTVKMQGERQIRMLQELSARATDVRSEEDTYRVASEVLSGNELDLPFTLLYALDEKVDEVRLVGVSRWKDYLADTGAEILSLRDGGDAPLWPLAAALRGGEDVVVEDLALRVGALPVGEWGARPERAIVLPLARPGQRRPIGFLIAGLSPHRVFDDRYHRFFRDTADLLTTVVVNARAREAERKRIDALAELDQAKTAFFSNVSHELRTPLTLMLGPTEEALRSPTRTLSGESLEMVHRNALRLMKLVNSLLEFSRIESGRVRACYVPSDLAAVTIDLASLFRSAIESAGLELRVECEPMPEPIYIDHDMWEKIVLNLLSNALKFTFEGTIGVTLRWHGDHAELEVSDTGAGVPEEELPHLFERFHRVRGVRARTHEGSGIGLALTRDLVGLHGGSIRVESRPGEGTKFTVSIPRGSLHLAPQDIGAEAQSAWSSRGGASFVEDVRASIGVGADHEKSKAESMPGVARVLVVDDNVDLSNYIAKLLGEQYVVEIASDGIAALEAARSRRPDLVVSDVMMPHLDGFGFVQAMRADPLLSGVPIILLSARAGDEATVEGLAVGADDYLVKPFAARELLARVRTHVELARQREAFERFFALSVDILAIASLDGSFKRVSPAFDALGYSRQEFQALPLLELVHPDDKAATMDAIKEVASGAPAKRFENRYRCKDGSYRWISWSGVVDASRTLYAIGRDVTDAKDAVEAVRSANHFLEAVIENIPDMIFVKDATELRFVRFNAAGESLLGVSREDLIGKSDYDLFPEADAAFFQSKDRETLRDKVTVEILEEPLEAKGGRRWLHTKKVPILGPDGTPQFLLGISEDITERKQAEEARARLAAIVESSEDAIIGRSLDGLITSWNKGAERMFGYSAEEVVGKAAPPLTPPELQAEAALLAKRMADGERVEHFVTVRRRKDGREVHVSANLSPIHDSSGRLIGTAAIARDVTAEVRNREALVQAKEAADAAIRELESFSYSVAHDLRAPLRSIDGFSQALVEDYSERLDEVGLKYLGFVRESAQLMAQLIDDMLNLARVTRSEMNREKVDLSALARATQARLERLDPTRRVEWKIDEGLVAYGDPRLLGVVLDNLLGNAWKFTGKRAAPKIEVGATSKGGRLTYFVRDNGAGFDAKYANKLFGAFQRLHAAHEFEGTGIGLATVQRIVGRHGGSVWADGVVDAGATFYFTLGDKEWSV